MKRRGKRETWPATASGRKAPRCLRSRRLVKVCGMRISKIAFSWTCQPKRKDEYAVSVRVERKFGKLGRKKSFVRAGWRSIVSESAEKAGVKDHTYQLSEDGKDES